MLLRFLHWLGARLVSYAYSLMQSIVWCAILVALLALGWVAWPVSAWLLGAYVLHWILSYLANILNRPGRLPAFRRVVAHAARGLARSVAYVGFGIFLVALAQTLLWGGAQAIEPALVRQAEVLLSHAYHGLLSVMSLEVLAIALAVLVAIVLVQPRSSALARFLSLRRVASKVALVLLGVTSFTFFGALDMQSLDPEWRASERYRARATLNEIATDTREMAAAAWVEAETHKLDEAAKRDFASFFAKARGTLFAVEIARAAGSELAGKAPRLSAPGQKDVQLDNLIPERVQSYLEGHASAGSPEPSLSELRAANERLVAHELRLRAARTTAIELASEAFAGLMPASERPLVNAFVQGLSSSLARGALQEVLPARVADVQGARDWVRTNVLSANPVERVHVPHTWQFNVASVERGAVRTSELLIAALVTRLHAQQVAAHAQAARLGALSAARPPSARPSRVYFRG
jgi:hypothetical protein